MTLQNQKNVPYSAQKFYHSSIGIFGSAINISRHCVPRNFYAFLSHIDINFFLIYSCVCTEYATQDITNKSNKSIIDQKFRTAWTPLSLLENIGRLVSSKIDFHFFFITEIYRIVSQKQLPEGPASGGRPGSGDPIDLAKTQADNNGGKKPCCN